MKKIRLTLPYNPWPGPSSYQDPETSEHELKFCGREREIFDLTRLIDDSFFVTLYGMSGIGKSSLLNAGVFPALRKMQYIPVSVRLLLAQEESFQSLIIKTIEQAVENVGGHIEKINVVKERDDDQDNDYLWRYFAIHSFQNKDGDVLFPVIVLDQFEEVLRSSESRKNAERLLAQIAYLVDENHAIEDCVVNGKDYAYDFNFRFVLSIREDDLYRLEDSIDKGFLDILKQNRFRLRGMDRDSARQVVTQPALGLISDEEAEEIIKHLKENRGEDYDIWNPAILSLCMFLYYEKNGNTDPQKAFAEYYRVSTDAQHIDVSSLSYLEDHLLTEDGNRSLLLLDEAFGHVPERAIVGLIDCKIIQKVKRNGIDYIEFSHDRLCAEAKNNREERIVREQARKARKRMLLSFFVFAVSVGILAYVLLLSSRLQTAEEQNDIINRQKQEIALQRDSIDKSLRFQESQNSLILRQKGEIAAQRDSIRMSLQEQEKQNKQLKSQMAVIEEQQRRIDELQLGTRDVLAIANKKAGRLSDVLPYSALNNAVSLTISGDLNGTDIKYLRDNGIKNLKSLNLADANIIRGGANYYSGEYENSRCITENNVIGPYMFFEWRGLETIILPRTTTVIGDNAFRLCTNLSSVTIPNGVTIIGNGAFGTCWNLSSVSIPNSVTSIGSYAFQYCSGLTSVTIPSRVRSIGDNAFSGCSLYDFINNSACTSDSFWGALVSDSPRSDGLVIRDNVLLKCKVDSDSVIIPEGVTSIGDGAFSECWRLTSVTIPNSVTSIGYYAFSGCGGLTSITIPNSVSIIEDRAFENCYGLTSVNIPNSVTYIGEGAFSGCDALASVVIPNSVTSISESTFLGCSGLTSVTIPNSVTSIGLNAFDGCTSLTSVNIPNSVSFIAMQAFNGCQGLSSVTIPDGVTIIGGGTFQDCSGLQSVTIPNSVNSIGELAFYNCTNLNQIFSEIEDIQGVFARGNLTGSNIPFYGLPSTCTWHIPVGKSREYKSQPWWVPTWNIVEDIKVNKGVSASYKNGLLKIDALRYNLLPVAGGTYMMGTSDEMIAAGFGTVVTENGDTVNWSDFERPVHEVTLDGYRIGETEVTQALWTAVMGSNPSEVIGNNLPVDNVSWDECQYFIHKLNTLTGVEFRMPTEAEWEFAARGGNNSRRTPFSGSDDPDAIGWFAENSGNRVHPVKQKRPNELGIYDMNGNVMEFCLDKNYDYDSKPQKNPIGMSNDSQRIVRGGSADSSSKAGYVSMRLMCEPDEKFRGIGLRLAISE